MPADPQRVQHQHDLLTQLRALQERRQHDETLEKDLVRQCRQTGLSWEDVAQALGRSRSSVWKKHGP